MAVLNKCEIPKRNKSDRVKDVQSRDHYKIFHLDEIIYTVYCTFKEVTKNYKSYVRWIFFLPLVVKED